MLPSAAVYLHLPALSWVLHEISSHHLSLRVNPRLKIHGEKGDGDREYGFADRRSAVLTKAFCGRPAPIDVFAGEGGRTLEVLDHRKEDTVDHRGWKCQEGWVYAMRLCWKEVLEVEWTQT